ncbi:AAA family ATPase [Bacillus ndiopicus]|uniref:AAA family ATPase n=1 Tax=Bacillus ndiopicus TaxID=1347368 RepID=UPI0005A80BF6|nr:hypothetical protein [Bacillus ndiopicus]
MIPYVLKIHGVRDYASRSIALGEAHEHILITGPNGVGKSTLTFCIGAIFYSAKVDIEGLRSNNLAADKPWNARMALIFKNEGSTRIDGPPFIAFELIVHQPVKNGVIQKEYRVLTGETEEHLTNVISYTSGNTMGRNFSAYKEDLQNKYKIDPDLYYLIWYQQEVNQFAAMNPEERFRQFSNMFHITDMQKQWEAALESVREVEREIEQLSSIVRAAESNLRVAENDFNNFKNNRRRLIENGSKYYTFTTVLLRKFTNELEKERAVLLQLKEEKKGLLQQQEVCKHQKEVAIQRLKNLEDENAEIVKQLTEKKAELKEWQGKESELQKECNQLLQQLEAISEKAKLLRFDEETTFAKYDDVVATKKQLEEQEEQLQQLAQSLKEQEQKIMKESAKIEANYHSFQQQLEKAYKDVDLYTSSSHIESQIKQANIKLEEIFKEQQSIVPRINKSEQMIQQLQKKQVRSTRQQQGLQDLRKKGMEAYTLRELLELAPNASLKLEEKIEAIKYTIFYNGSSYRPINDLYYVPLKQVVPDRIIVNLPQLGLQMRSDLSEQLQNYANKALWWVEQFFIKAPQIKNGILIDERGSRGAQEQLQYILSDVAIQQMLQEQENILVSLKQAKAKLDQQYDNNQTIIQQLYGAKREIQEAESILLREGELGRYKKQLEQLDEQLSSIYDTQNDTEKEQHETQKQLVSIEHEFKLLIKECQIYEELGAAAAQQRQLQQLEEQLNTAQQNVKLLNQQRGHFVSKLENKTSEVQLQSIETRKCQADVEFVEENLTKNNLKISHTNERIDILDVEKESLTIKLHELEQILPQEAYVIDEAVSITLSKETLRNGQEQYAAAFENARTEKVNVNAEKNYEVMKNDFDRKKNELATAEILLEENANRAAENEDKLETTINMHLTKINLLFQKYMDQFYFEGKIEKERVEEKKTGRIKYLLFVKARKIGHGGDMEDVSLKARHGKVGKGVSGGEESLSSLLFALALLQNLSISPSYIVLDEFDSALDDERKDKVFDLYAKELKRKLIILSPKGHDSSYYNYFSKAFIIEHNSSIPQSFIRGVERKEG